MWVCRWRSLPSVQALVKWASCKGKPRVRTDLQSSLRERGGPAASQVKADRRSCRAGTVGARARDFQRSEDRDAESRSSFARVGHMVSLVGKACRAVFNHPTVRHYRHHGSLALRCSLVLGPLTCLRLLFAGTPVAVGCTYLEFVLRFYPGVFAYRDPVVDLWSGDMAFLH